MGMLLGFGYIAMGDESQALSATEALNGKSLCGHVLLVIHAAAPPLPRRAEFLHLFRERSVNHFASLRGR